MKRAALSTLRLALEPVTEQHAHEMHSLFSDPELHIYVPFQVPTLEEQTARCARWSKGRSPDGKDLWLNWAGRDLRTGRVIAHFQATVGENLVAWVGYLVARMSQRQGFATEGLKAVLDYLRRDLKVREVKASTDARNTASHRLATRLGMTETERLKDANTFEGETSDELIFSMKLER